jgi:FkbM family methyltransferase
VVSELDRDSRRVIDRVIGALPGRRAMLRAGVRLPPVLRSAFTYRVLAAIARRTLSSGMVDGANFGISSQLRCEVPSDRVLALYGKPNLYRGERASLELAARFAAHSDAFLDIGAHLGFFTFLVRARAPRGLPIHFFEPDADLYALLDRNVRANALGHVVGHNVAVGAHDGTATFFVNRSDSFSGSLTTMFAETHEVVPATVAVQSFASIASEIPFARACVKVDVEGAEHQFLDGAASALDRVAFLIMEVLAPAVSGGFVRRMIDTAGLHAYYINDYALEHSVDGSFTEQQAEYNWLFCRQAPLQLRRTLAGSRFRIESGSPQA